MDWNKAAGRGVILVEASLDLAFTKFVTQYSSLFLVASPDLDPRQARMTASSNPRPKSEHKRCTPPSVIHFALTCM